MKSILQLLLHVKKTRSALDRGRKADTNGGDSSRNTMCVASSESLNGMCGGSSGGDVANCWFHMSAVLAII